MLIFCYLSNLKEKPISIQRVKHRNDVTPQLCALDHPDMIISNLMENFSVNFLLPFYFLGSTGF